MYKYFIYLIVGLWLLCPAALAQENLLSNPSADSGDQAWLAIDDAKIESVKENFYFVVRNKGSFWQKISVPQREAGKYMLLIARGATERINADGSTAGMPCLIGSLMSYDGPMGSGRINTFMNYPTLRLNPKAAGEWGVMYGIARIPKRTVDASVFLKQADSDEVRQTSPAARFDDVGFYIFNTAKEALKFVKHYGK